MSGYPGGLGSLPHEQALRSLRLFAEEVMQVFTESRSR